MDCRIGDKVKLRSGSPVMEVIGLSRNGFVWCEWMLSDGQVWEDCYLPEMLVQTGLAGTKASAENVSV